MKYKIKETKYVTNLNLINEALDDVSDAFRRELLRGIANSNWLTNKTTFDDCNYYYTPDDCAYGYYFLSGEIGAYVVREDNIEFVEEGTDFLAAYGISKIITAGKNTILIDDEGNKVVTHLQPGDKNDIEKAVMMVLLKYAGYKVKDIYKMVDMIKPSK